MDRAIQIRSLVEEMYKQRKEYLMLGTDPGSMEKAAALKEEIVWRYSEISLYIKIRSDLSESRKEKKC